MKDMSHLVRIVRCHTYFCAITGRRETGNPWSHREWKKQRTIVSSCQTTGRSNYENDIDSDRAKSRKRGQRSKTDVHQEQIPKACVANI